MEKLRGAPGGFRFLLDRRSPRDERRSQLAMERLASPLFERGGPLEGKARLTRLIHRVWRTPSGRLQFSLVHQCATIADQFLLELVHLLGWPDYFPEEPLAAVYSRMLVAFVDFTHREDAVPVAQRFISEDYYVARVVYPSRVGGCALLANEFVQSFISIRRRRLAERSYGGVILTMVEGLNHPLEMAYPANDPEPSAERLAELRGTVDTLTLALNMPVEAHSGEEDEEDGQSSNESIGSSLDSVRRTFGAVFSIGDDSEAAGGDTAYEKSWAGIMQSHKPEEAFRERMQTIDEERRACADRAASMPVS